MKRNRTLALLAVFGLLLGAGPVHAGVDTATGNIYVEPVGPNAVSHTDTSPSTVNITAADVASSTATGANGQSIITGTPTANSAASFALSGQAVTNIQASGTWAATLVTEISFDGGTTYYTRGIHQFGTNYNASTFTANFAGEALASGATNIRVRCTAFTSGTAVVRITESLNPGVTYIINSPSIADGSTPSQKLAISASGAASIGGNVADGATDSGNPSTIAGYYHSGADTYTNGQRVEAHFDSAGNLRGYNSGMGGGESLNTYTNVPSGVKGTQGITPFIPISSDFSVSTYYSSLSGSQVVSGYIKTGAGQIIGGRCSNANAAFRYLWITSGASAPAGSLASSDASVVDIVGLPPTSSTPLDMFPAGGRNAANISFGFSTSATSYTAGTASDCQLDLTYN